MAAHETRIVDGEHEGRGEGEVQGAGAAREVSGQEVIVVQRHRWLTEMAEEIRFNENQLRQLDAGIFAGRQPFEGTTSILAGGGGAILVGAGFPLPAFVQLPLPWWCRTEEAG